MVGMDLGSIDLVGSRSLIVLLEFLGDLDKSKAWTRPLCPFSPIQIMREPNISKQQLSTYHANSFSTGVIGVIGVMHALYLRSHQVGHVLQSCTISLSHIFPCCRAVLSISTCRYPTTMSG